MCSIISSSEKYPNKKSHFACKLEVFEPVENIIIPDEIYNIIKTHLDKRNTKYELCTLENIGGILSHNNLFQYTNHKVQIYCHISGSSPLTLSKETDDTLINMFGIVCELYNKHKPEYRTGFINYSYIIHKLFKILNMPQHANYFALLKSTQKLKEIDTVWEKICNDAGWKFYKSST